MPRVGERKLRVCLPIKSVKRPRGLLRVLLILALVAGVGAGLVIFSSRSSTPSQVTYQGRMYMGVAVELQAIEAEAKLGRLERGSGSVDSRSVFTARRSGYIALRDPDGHYDVYQRMP